MRCLFRFNLGGEIVSGEIERAQGLGHAVRCVTLADELAGGAGAEILLVADRNPVAEAYLADAGHPFVLGADEVDAARSFAPQVIVIDINHLEARRIERLRAIAPVVNLAPRGLPKFYADATISNVVADDMPQPADARPRRWHRGPEYGIVRPQFRSLRAAALSDSHRVAVLMGGLDQAGLTAAVIEQLAALAEPFALDVVVGKLNPHANALSGRLAKLGGESRLYVDPPNVHEILGRASVAIVGTGNVVDETLTMGVPTVCIGLSSFHDLRGRELERLGVAVYAGRAGSAPVGKIVGELLRDDGRRAELQRRAIASFDGLGCARAAAIVREFARDRASQIQMKQA